MLPRGSLVLGSESHGLSDGDVRLDGVLRIPMVGGVESLNVAAAGAIALHTLGRAVTASSDGTAR